MIALPDRDLKSPSPKFCLKLQLWVSTYPQFWTASTEDSLPPLLMKLVLINLPHPESIEIMPFLSEKILENLEFSTISCPFSFISKREF